MGPSHDRGGLSKESARMLTSDDALRRVEEAGTAGRLSKASVAAIRRWLNEPPFAAYRDDLLHAIESASWADLDDAFYEVLPFGTGGRRGKMYPVGTNVLNKRTIGESARGLADYVNARLGPDAPKSCVIARDTRHNSPEFSDLCARVLAAAGFKVFVFEDPRSTPLLSFAVRYLKCDAGIMITASHNAPSDNGFKCYAATGGQVVPPDDTGIIACVEAASEVAIPEITIAEGRARGRIITVGPEVDDAYLAAVVSAAVGVERNLSIVYTPMHGVGESSVAAALRRARFAKVNVLESQRAPDGDFPNVPGHVSNPEIPKTLDAAIAEARASSADLVIASDPDADRIGVGIPVSADPKGPWTTLDGNQIGAVLTAFIVEKMSAAGLLRPEHYIVTTLVSSTMARAIAHRYGVRAEDDLLVGFKWIAVRIDEAGPAGFLFAFEESHGYLKGTHVRDKDAAVAALLFADLAADLKKRGKTVNGYLDELYLEYGDFGERLINKVLTGREGAAQIQKLMAAFRNNPPKTLDGLTLTKVDDYQKHESRSLQGGATTALPKPSGDLLIFHAEAPGVRFAVRPSGTEPKMKLYLFARTETQGKTLADLPAIKAETDRRLDQMTADLHAFMDAALATN